MSLSDYSTEWHNKTHEGTQQNSQSKSKQSKMKVETVWELKIKTQLKATETTKNAIHSQNCVTVKLICNNMYTRGYAGHFLPDMCSIMQKKKSGNDINTQFVQQSGFHCSVCNTVTVCSIWSRIHVTAPLCISVLADFVTPTYCVCHSYYY